MILKKASSKAVKYSCINFHYAKAVPVVSLAFSVFNTKNEWCGVICYGGGASVNMGKPYKLRSGEYLELVRVALNGKQESTSKALALSIKLVKKHAPTVQLIISYADKGQDHKGIIYQATNWIYVGDSKSSGVDIYWKGKWRHNRTMDKIPKQIRSTLKKRTKPGKYKYLYPLENKLRLELLQQAKEYPK